MAEDQPASTQRLVVALVRGVHGLRGAVRVEVLTDRPGGSASARASCSIARASDAPLTIASAEAVADGPGWRLRFREIATREAADGLRGAYLETVVHPVGDLARGEVYWHEVRRRRPCAASMAPSSGVVEDVYRVGENEVYVVRGEPFGTFDLPAVRAFIRIFAPRRGEIVVDADGARPQAAESATAAVPVNGRGHRGAATRRPRTARRAST